MAYRSGADWRYLKAKAEAKAAIDGVRAEIEAGRHRDPRVNPIPNDVTKSKNGAATFIVKAVEKEHVFYRTAGSDLLVIPLREWRIFARFDKILWVGEIKGTPLGLFNSTI